MGRECPKGWRRGIGVHSQCLPQHTFTWISHWFEVHSQTGAQHRGRLGEPGPLGGRDPIELEIGAPLDMQLVSASKEHEGNRPAGTGDVRGAAGPQQTQIVQQDNTVEAVGVTVGFLDLQRGCGGEGGGAFDPQPHITQPQ